MDETRRRRAYWAEQMDTAFDFMTRVRDYPVQECGESMVFLPDVVASAGLAVAFSSSQIVEGLDRMFYLREGLIDDFIGIAGEMNRRGWTLRVEDGFRSTEMQKRLALKETIFDRILEKVIWETDTEAPDTDLLYRRISVLIATAPKVGTHMSGSAIDISVLRTEDLGELDRGAPYIELSELTPMRSPFVPQEARRTRLEITEVMNHYGFVAYPFEFWHYNKDDAYAEYLNESGRPARYGAIDFDPESGTVSVIENPELPLHTLDEVQERVEEALRKRQAG